jgi:carbon-monoxide dehydrogenase small subunit
MKALVKLKVNGRTHELAVDTRAKLAEVIRDELRLTGTHIGCGTGSCGACTVMLDGQTVKSCCVLAVDAAGQDVTTIEGLAKPGELTPLQQCFVTHHGLQCGYCTPGMVLSAHQLLAENPKPTEDEIRHAIAGNLCRCTGYQNIVKSIKAASGQ